ncbi:glycosyltransferase [Clostridium perfringens]|uniref:glycosyltransferase n=1 Tax=Clostridium perfringens TaxID=1502 RepID=UPI000A46E4E7|nr:glycosyltransferase [Clostridium perfringens]MDG6889897.1 glycosyl transferase, group 1 family [Clostridium perfringens]MDM0935279.1 glycosyltransferase [Clostridium perfringens]MDU5774814.1 glycosyltransferase [Clostridium perfringens]MDU7783009.1 glycosyltransferase [Clostridium perfringens]MDU7897882.1 glycosyltransferase [Clostridium perfringens]
MKKLLFITWSVSYGYGTEKSLADVLNRFDNTKYDISILPLFKYSNNSIFNNNIKLLEPIIDYTDKNLDEVKALKNYYNLLSNPSLFNKWLRKKYDCIIACNHNAPSYFASYIVGGKKIVWIRGDMSELDYNVLDKTTNEYKMVKQEHEMQANVLKVFDKIVVISEVTKNTLKNLFGITKNVVKISNSVDGEKIKFLSEKTVKIPEKTLFTTLGRLDYNKNQILLLKAVREVKKYYDDFIIYILGDGDERLKLERYINDNKLNENVRILGFVENPYPYIKNSVATILTSLSEGFSLALVESVMLNTPIISTDVGVARELIEKYNCGTIIDYNEKELAQVLIRYLNKYDGCKKAFSIGDEYNINTEVEKTRSLIENVLGTARVNSKIERLPYPEYTIKYCDLNNISIKNDIMYVLRVLKDNVPYEYLINRKSNSDKLIVFNNGAIAGGNVNVPVFQRHSWANKIKTSSVFCMDPTIYIDDYLQTGWGVGKNENYYLENSSLILKTIIEKMNISLDNTVIYGTSAGGYLSIIMGIYLKGAKVVADNAQLDTTRWIFKEALDSVITFCFDNVSDSLKYKERFSIIEAFKKSGYVPKIYLHVNLCSVADNSTQLVPFLCSMEESNDILGYNDIEVILHYEKEKGHNGLNFNDAIKFLYKVLDEN